MSPAPSCRRPGDVPADDPVPTFMPTPPEHRHDDPDFTMGREG